jgi:hypothetical protein
LLREYFRQRDVVGLSKAAKNEPEALGKRIASTDLDENECRRSSRELQNAIYARRETCSLILPLIDRLNRKKMELSMKAGATQMLTKYRSQQLGRRQPER